MDSVLVAAHAAESAWRRHRDASRKANELEVSLLGLRNLAEAAACDLQGARIALQSWCDGESGSGNGASGLGLEPSVRALLHGHIGERVASAERKALEAERKRSDAETEASDARAALATAQRAHKPTYEEVRKRALRIRLAAEERCERQIARAASRAERDVDVKKKKLKKERGVAGDTGGGGCQNRSSAAVMDRRESFPRRRRGRARGDTQSPGRVQNRHGVVAGGDFENLERAGRVGVSDGFFV